MISQTTQVVTIFKSIGIKRSEFSAQTKKNKYGEWQMPTIHIKTITASEKIYANRYLLVMRGFTVVCYLKNKYGENAKQQAGTATVQYYEGDREYRDYIMGNVSQSHAERTTYEMIEANPSKYGLHATRNEEVYGNNNQYTRVWFTYSLVGTQPIGEPFIETKEEVQEMQNNQQDGTEYVGITKAYIDRASIITIDGMTKEIPGMCCMQCGYENATAWLGYIRETVSSECPVHVSCARCGWNNDGKGHTDVVNGLYGYMGWNSWDCKNCGVKQNVNPLHTTGLCKTCRGDAAYYREYKDYNHGYQKENAEHYATYWQKYFAQWEGQPVTDASENAEIVTNDNLKVTFKLYGGYNGSISTLRAEITLDFCQIGSSVPTIIQYDNHVWQLELDLDDTVEIDSEYDKETGLMTWKRDGMYSYLLLSDGDVLDLNNLV